MVEYMTNAKAFLMLLLMTGWNVKADDMCANDINKELGATKSLFQVASFVTKSSEEGICPKPSADNFKELCANVNRPLPSETENYKKNFSYNWEKRLWDISCVSPGDDEEIAISKIQTMWSKYKNSFVCNENSAFPLTNGSILKYAVHQSFWHMINTLVDTYELDINFKDVVDNKNVIDYINDEIKRLDPTGARNNAAVETLISQKRMLESLGAKASR